MAILGSQFEGPEIRGSVRPGRSDRQLVGADGVRRLHALYEMETDDGAVITVRNRVRLYVAGYGRSRVELTAALDRYEWLNRRVFIGMLDSLAPQPQVLVRVFVID